MSSQLTPQHYHEIASNRGFMWIGEFPSSGQVKTTWQCVNGHTWQAAYRNLRNGSGCPACYDQRRGDYRKRELSDYLILAEKLSLTLVGDIPPFTADKALWRCANGHEFQSAYRNLRDAVTYNTGNGCSACRYEKLTAINSLKIDDFNSLATHNGITWLGTEAVRVKAKTTWRCANGHDFEQSYFRIQQGDCKCPHCPTNEHGKWKTAADYHALSEIGFTWIGETFVASQQYTQWRCVHGHEFKQTYQNLARGICDCPECGDRVNGVTVSKAQRAIHAMVGGEINYRLKSRTGRYTIDVALDVDKLFPIAIEYDSSYYHNADHDTKRDAFLVSRGWYIIHIKADQIAPTKQQLDDAIERIYQGEQIVEIWLDWRGRKPIGT